MARSRTTKTLAKRIELDYFHRRHPWRTWRARASWIGVAAAALAIAWWCLPARRIVWSSGPLSGPHAVLQADCASCHGTDRHAARGAPTPVAGAPLFAGSAAAGPVTDGACLACHAGPAHHADRREAPACASCHAEHGGGSLVAVVDSHCAACHADLTAGIRAPSEVARSVTAFPAGHPEFDAVERARDPGRLRLNHKLHLAPGLRGAQGPVTLTCASCHHPDEAASRMRPVNYETECASCHPLLFDTEGRLPVTATVPHGDPSAALATLVEIYAGAAVSDAGAASSADPVAAALARQRSRKARLEEAPHVPLSMPAGSERGFVVERVGLAVTVLERQTCALCHGTGHTGKGGAAPMPNAAPPPAGGSVLPGPPSIPEPAVPERWMPRSEFSHRAHRALACGSCHANALTSEATSDVLLPGQQLCASCHQSDGGASTACVTCHRYHPPEPDPLAPARFSLP